MTGEVRVEIISSLKRGGIPLEDFDSIELLKSFGLTTMMFDTYGQSLWDLSYELE